MEITLSIPDDLAAQALGTEQEPARAALETLAVEGYRAQRLSEAEVRRILGYESRIQVHALLKRHNVYLTYTFDDLDKDIESSNRAVTGPRSS